MINSETDGVVFTYQLSQQVEYLKIESMRKFQNKRRSQLMTLFMDKMKEVSKTLFPVVFLSC